MKHYTYGHYTADTGELFYVGKGSERRFQQGTAGNRSAAWQSLADSHGFKAEIFSRWESEAEAFEHEKFLISTMREMGIKLVNVSVGGPGALGVKRSPEECEKIGLRYRGKKLSESHCKNIGISKSGIKQSPETIEKRVAHLRGKKRTPETIAKVVAANKVAYRKNILCVERGVTFDYLQDAVDWLKSMGMDKARKSNICGVANGYVNKAYGFTWKYVNQGSGI